MLIINFQNLAKNPPKNDGPKMFWLSAWLCQKEKESWSSVGGFGMETSNFALNGCLRVSTVRFFDARSNGRLRMSHRAL